ncbi:MAG: sn-glycerol-3-phosphate ABC transporter ATP-binding protein UgpC [Anaerolineae bacterium]|nr:sn-glycerol-3-phosphate ABC transporter ATP-binding protein UgpC [Gloeobacterales cyanobacterium ES-bin-313]
MGEVELIGVGKTYARYKALENIDLRVAPGELLVLVGPSGCGKSTLLRAIAGLETIDHGQIRIGDQVVADTKCHIPPRQRDVAMVFQNYALYPHMSVAENLAFGLRMRGIAKFEREKRVQTIAHLLSIEGLLERKPAQLSGGQQQRVAVGRALVRDPQIFLLDEPLSNLDTELRNQTRIELKRLHQDLKTTMIYVTHDQVEAMTLADRLVVMSKGKLQQVGSPQAVYQDPDNVMVAQFLGSPLMNLFEIHRQAQGWVWQGEILPKSILEPLLASATQERLWLGLRPEALHCPAQEKQPVGQFIVEMIEPLGNETIVQGRIGVTSASLRTAKDLPWCRGDQVSVSLDLNAALLFDPDTGNRYR